MAEATVLVNAIGVGAALCSMTSFVPQIVKLLRERDGAGVSIRMYLMSTVGFVLWTAYGWLSQSWPVAGSNTINLLFDYSGSEGADGR